MTHQQTDRDQIVEALARFASHTDLRDWDGIRAALTPDCRAYGAEGPEAVVARMQAFLGGVGPTQHLLGNHRVQVDGDTARSLTYGRVHHVGAGPMEGSFYECMGEYEDHWRRTDAGWLLHRRDFEIRISLGEWGVLRPADEG